jgi:hypothetical protein
VGRHYSWAHRHAVFAYQFHYSRRSAAEVTKVKTTPAKHTEEQKELFKSLRPVSYEALYDKGSTVTAPEGLEVFKKAQRHPKDLRKMFGPESAQNVRKSLNSHGAVDGPEAFGPKSHEMQDPPSRGDANASELGRKKKKIPANGHHGATPAVSYGVGKPRVKPPADASTHAPPHSSYLHEPPNQPTQTKSAGGGDELRKRETAAQAIKQAQRRAYSSPDDI